MEVVVFYSQSMAVFSWNWMTHFFHKVMIVWPAQAFKNHQATRQFPPPCPPSRQACPPTKPSKQSLFRLPGALYRHTRFAKGSTSIRRRRSGRARCQWRAISPLSSSCKRLLSGTLPDLSCGISSSFATQHVRDSSACFANRWPNLFGMYG